MFTSSPFLKDTKLYILGKQNIFIFDDDGVHILADKGFIYTKDEEVMNLYNIEC